MAKTDTRDISATISQIKRLEGSGCEIVRVAVKDIESAKAICEIKKEIDIPLVADIHFDHKLALEAILCGADKIRINPGNMKEARAMEEVAHLASEKGIPVRIGVNSGSLPATKRRDPATGRLMAELALKSARCFEETGFRDIVISLKASDIGTTVEAYKIMGMESDYPLHLGVTAAGSPKNGIVRSSVGIGALLLEGIGDTVRVSLTGDPVTEVDTAKRILSSLGIRHFGPEIISCPTCGRCRVDLVSMVKELEDKLKRNTQYTIRNTRHAFTIALMGCEVNGPGEAKNADIGIAFGDGKGAIFRNGKVVKTVKAENAIDELIKLTGKM